MYAKSIETIALTPDGITIAFLAKDNKISVFNTVKGKFTEIQCSYNTERKSVTLSPNGKYLAFIERNQVIKIFNVKTGKEIRSFESYANWLFKLAFSPNGNVIASVGGEGIVNLWEIKTGELIKTFKGSDLGIEVVFSQDNRMIAAGFLDEKIKLWELKTEKEIVNIENLDNKALLQTMILTIKTAFSPDGKMFASSGNDNLIKLWNVETGQLINLFKGHNSYVESLQFSSDGKKLLSGSDNDNTIILWYIDSILSDIETDKKAKVFSNQTDFIKSVLFLQDDKFFISVSNNTTLKLWNENDDKPLATLTLLDEENWIITSANGRFDTSISLDEIGDLPLIIYKSVPNMELPDFKKFYFEKDLLKRLLAGEEFTPLTETFERENSHPQIHIIEINSSDYTENFINNLSDLDNSYENTSVFADKRMITDEEYENYVKPYQNTDVITIETLNTNATTSSITENIDGMVRVNVQILQKEILEDSLLPFDFTVSMVIDELVDALDLPRSNEKEQKVNYTLYSNYQNRYLANFETIQGAQISNDDTLQLLTYEENSYENADINSMPQEVDEKDLERREFFEEWKKQIRESKIDFSKLKWREGNSFLRYKLFFWGGMNITLREYTKNRSKTKDDDSWCEARHFGYIVQGKAEINFGDKKVIFRRGNGICIPKGTRHQLRLLSKKMVIFHIDEHSSKD